jgi:hypothetical protein
MAAEESRVKETIVTEELYDMIIFLVHSFVRPIETEFYALKHKHVSDPRALLLTIADDKTGFRLSNTMPAAATVYERIKKPNPEMSGPEDYLFFTQYEKRSSASELRNGRSMLCLNDAPYKIIRCQSTSTLRIRPDIQLSA